MRKYPAWLLPVLAVVAALIFGALLIWGATKIFGGGDSATASSASSAIGAVDEVARQEVAGVKRDLSSVKGDIEVNVKPALRRLIDPAAPAAPPVASRPSTGVRAFRDFADCAAKVYVDFYVDGYLIKNDADRRQAADAWCEAETGERRPTAAARTAAGPDFVEPSAPPR